MSNERDLLSESERLASEGKVGDAVKLLSEAISTNPTGAIYHERAYCYEMLSEHQKAWDDYSTAVGLEPSSIRHLLARGMLACFKLGRDADGFNDFYEAIAIDPDSPRPHQNLSFCYSILGNMEKADWHANRAIELDPNDATSHSSLGTCHRAAKDFRAAAQEFEKAISLEPRNVAYWEELAWVQYCAKDYTSSAASYRAAIEIEPSARSHINLASVLLELGNPNEALAQLILARGFQLDDAQQALVSAYTRTAQLKLGMVSPDGPSEISAERD
jgi:tetratricopeptide (TPR) repeat protein